MLTINCNLHILLAYRIICHAASVKESEVVIPLVGLLNKISRAREPIDANHCFADLFCSILEIKAATTNCHTNL
jgi:hypothetical protein